MVLVRLFQVGDVAKGRKGLRVVAQPRRAAVMAFAVAVVGLGVAGVVALPGRTAVPGSQAGRFAAAADAFQNKALDSAMEGHPGGTRVSPSEAEWKGGKVILRVSAPHAPLTATTMADTTDYGGCPNTYFCAWSEPGFPEVTPDGACEIELSDSFYFGSTYWFDWASFSGSICGSAGTWSWANHSAYRVWKEQYYNEEGTQITPAPGEEWVGGAGSGNNWCISPYVSNSDVTDQQTREDGWIYLSSNTASC